MSQLQRRVRGLLNRMSDSNLPGIVADVMQLAELEGERAIADTITAELLQVSACHATCCCKVLRSWRLIVQIQCDAVHNLTAAAANDLSLLMLLARLVVFP